MRKTVADGKYAVGDVECHDGWNLENPSQDDREEMVLFGSSAIASVTQNVMRIRDWPRAPSILHAARLLSGVLRDSEGRDQSLEDDIVKLAIQRMELI